MTRATALHGKRRFSRLMFSALAVLVTALAGQTAGAATGAEIDARVNTALDRLKAEVKGSDGVLAQARGVLVFPEVIKAGFIFAGEGGEGALRIAGKTVDYYNIMSASVGLQAGGQKRDIIVAFLDADSLTKFRNSQGWKVGADGSVTLIDTGAAANVDITRIKEPIVAFVVGQKGLMAGISLDGSKITKSDKTK